MMPLAFEDLARLPVVRDYETSFRNATGVSLRLAPPQAVPPASSLPSCGNGFCAAVACTPAGCAACRETESRALRTVARQPRLHQLHCYAGLTIVVSPVMVNGRHTATFLSGQVFRREPTERDFLMVLNMLGNGLSEDWVKKARKAYFETPVLTAERFQAAIQLMEFFARYLSEFAGQYAIAVKGSEPEAVTNAKQFVRAHVEETITLDQVIHYVHVSRFYFCKLFKKTTGMTLTDYVARVRVENAKKLLSDPGRRISEVVFASGFGSIPRFNSVFKEHVGMAPSEYRATLKAQILPPASGST